MCNEGSNIQISNISKESPVPKKESKKANAIAEKKEEEKVQVSKERTRKTPKSREGPKAATTAFFYYQADRR